jgi:hypothetical protein
MRLASLRVQAYLAIKPVALTGPPRPAPRLVRPDPRRTIMRVPRHCIACGTLAAALSAVTALPAAAADAASSGASACHAPTALQARLVAKADEGVDTLRDFVFTRRNILRVDMMEIGASLDNWRAGIECVRQAEAARDAKRVVATLAK